MIDVCQVLEDGDNEDINKVDEDTEIEDEEMNSSVKNLKTRKIQLKSLLHTSM